MIDAIFRHSASVEDARLASTSPAALRGARQAGTARHKKEP